jgi:hypothetical protein
VALDLERVDDLLRVAEQRKAIATLLPASYTPSDAASVSLNAIDFALQLLFLDMAVDIAESTIQ